jgi:hypothetical protein
VYEDVRPYRNDGASLLAIAQFTVALVKYLRDRFRNAANEPIGHQPSGYFRPREFRPVLSKSMILGMCHAHFVENYGQSKRVSIDTHVRSKFPLITSGGHPGGMETYTVRFWAAQASYVYVVDSHGNSIEHFKININELISLPLPDWFDELDSRMFAAEDTSSLVVDEEARQPLALQIEE